MTRDAFAAYEAHVAGRFKALADRRAWDFGLTVTQWRTEGGQELRYHHRLYYRENERRVVYQLVLDQTWHSGLLQHTDVEHGFAAVLAWEEVAGHPFTDEVGLDLLL